MKHVFNTNEVAHIWAAQKQYEGRNSGGNFYFEKEIIYSYGRHFPIARIVGNDVLFTLRRYSSSTDKHTYKTRSAISHKNIIWCYYVPTYLTKDCYEHTQNINEWKAKIKILFGELGNKRIRDIKGRIDDINCHINRLNIYCSFFKIKVKDKELKSLLKMAASPAFVESAREAKDKANAAHERKMKEAAKAYEQYIILWRNSDNKAISDMPDKTKELCNLYNRTANPYTRLRYNAAQNRVETSKGVQIPVEIAKRAFTALNGCIEGECNELDIPVLDYTITKTTKEALIAGCHTIPKEDVNYIANLLGWKA